MTTTQWKIFLRYHDESYKILKISQQANFDITIVPKNALYFSRKHVESLNIGDRVELIYDRLGQKVNHFSAHAVTGQRHIKLTPESNAHEPVIGTRLDTISKPVPLVTLVASSNAGSREDPGSNQWFGYNLAEDTNYLIMDIIAIPKDSNLVINKNFEIRNEKKTTEGFDQKILKMRNLDIVLLSQTTNHELTDIQNNVIFQQAEGKTAVISRVEKGKVIATISNLNTGAA